MEPIADEFSEWRFVAGWHLTRVNRRYLNHLPLKLDDFGGGGIDLFEELFECCHGYVSVLCLVNSLTI